MANKEIKEISELFVLPNENDIKKELEKLSKLDKKSNFQKRMLKAYSKNKLDDKDLRNFRSDICSYLINSRKEFLNSIKVYQIAIDDNKVRILQKHFIISQGKIIAPKDFCVYSKTQLNISISLASTYNDEEYYQKFIKNTLSIMDTLFNRKYLLEYFSSQLFKESQNYFFSNIGDFNCSLNKMLTNINWILSEENKLESKSKIEEEKDKESLNNKLETKSEKISLDNYKKIMKISRIKNEDVLIDIYNKSNGDIELIDNIKKIFNEKKDNDDIQVFLYNYELHENYGKQISIMKVNIHRLEEKNVQKEEDINNLNNKIDSLNKEKTSMNSTINKLSKNIDSLNIEKTSMNKTINQLNKSIDSLNKKINFMEPVVYSLISRKAINHCVCKILDTYKNSIAIEKKTNEKNDVFYNIKFVNDVNNIKKEDINKMLDFLFIRKDSFNENAHLIHFEKPQYITDLWEIILKYINFDDKKKIVFNSIVTDEIKNTFDFGQEDVNVKDYIQKKFNVC